MGHHSNLLRPLLLLLPFLFFACSGNPIDPGTFSGKTGGCSDFNVYRFNPDMTEALVVDARAQDLTIDRTPREFALPHPALNVRIDRFPGPAHAYYCDDVAGDAEPVRTWNAISGTVRITVGDTLDVQPWFTTYKVNVALRNVTLRDASGDEVFLREFEYGEVMVGWMPG